MSSSPTKLAALFPQESEIPAAYQIQLLHQREYLINGEMRQWDGTTTEVISPVYTQSETGLKRYVIGSYPVTGESEATEALNAAVKAYDNGRGEWPTMSVADRIACMERFVGRML